MWLSLFLAIYNSAYEESMAVASDAFSCLMGWKYEVGGSGVSSGVFSRVDR